MTPSDHVVFLLDVDNTLLDNDRVQDDLSRHLEREFGSACRDQYWALYEQLRAELGYADYLGALQRYRLLDEHNPHLLGMSAFLIDYPFANRLYPSALDVIERLQSWGPAVILSDGDVVFQPRKIQRSGLFEAVDGHVLVFIHKEQQLKTVEEDYPADHYVFIDDKLRILDTVKRIWDSRVTTVFPRQGHYAHDPRILTSYPSADITIERIGDLLNWDLPGLIAAGKVGARTVGAVATGGPSMKPTQKLHDVGQSLWLDNITRGLLTSGTLRRYIDELSVTGLTSNPTIFDLAIKGGQEYDAAIRQKQREGKSGERLFFELALEDLTQAADLFRPIHEATAAVDGWVSLEVSPLLAYDTKTTLAEAKQLSARGQRPNLFIKIPGTPQGLPAIEESIFAGVSINVTLLFSREQYLAAAEAYMRGIERRVNAGLNPVVGSVASLFISRWDKAVMGKAPDALRNQLGIAVAKRAYRAYRELLNSPRWLRLANAGARPQRLLWASTSTKDPSAPDTLYIKALASPFTVNTMPEPTLKAFADHGEVGDLLPVDGGDADEVLARYAKAGVDYAKLAADLQTEGAADFAKSWNNLLECIRSKSESLKKTG